MSANNSERLKHKILIWIASISTILADFIGLTSQINDGVASAESLARAVRGLFEEEWVQVELLFDVFSGTARPDTLVCR